MNTNDTDAALRRCEPIIRFLASVILEDFCHADVDDAVQAVRVKLWQKTIPAYDSSTGTAFDRFAMSAIRRALFDERAKLQTRGRRATKQLRERAVQDADAELERLCDDILANPGAYFTAHEARLIKALMESPDRGAAASALGIKVQSVHQGSMRLKRRILDLLQSRSEPLPRIA